MLRHDDSFSLCHSFIVIHYRLTTYQTYHSIIFPCSCLHLHGKPTLAPSSHCRTLQVLISYSRNVIVEISIFTCNMTAYCIGYIYIYIYIYIIYYIYICNIYIHTHIILTSLYIYLFRCFSRLLSRWVYASIPLVFLDELDQMRFRLDRGSSGPRHWTHGPQQRVSHRVTLAMDLGDPR